MDISQTANALKAMGIQKGDKVCLYLPEIPENELCLQACKAIAAITVVIQQTVSVQELTRQIQESEAHLVITADNGHLKQALDQALNAPNQVMQVLVIKNAHSTAPQNILRDVDFYLLVNRQAKQFLPEQSEYAAVHNKIKG